MHSSKCLKFNNKNRQNTKIKIPAEGCWMVGVCTGGLAPKEGDHTINQQLALDCTHFIS